MQIIKDKISLDYLSNLLESNEKITALFHANWSLVSNKIKDDFVKQEEDQYKNEKKIIIDIDNNGDLIRKLGINQIPSLVLITKDSLKNGCKIKTLKL